MVVRKFKQWENKEVLGVDTSSRSSPMFRSPPLPPCRGDCFIRVSEARSLDGNGFSICNIEGFLSSFSLERRDAFRNNLPPFSLLDKIFFSLFVISFEIFWIVGLNFVRTVYIYNKENREIYSFTAILQSLLPLARQRFRSCTIDLQRPDVAWISNTVSAVALGW